MRSHIPFLLLLFYSLLSAEKIELSDFYSAQASRDSSSKFYYDSILSCRQIKEERAKVSRYLREHKGYTYSPFFIGRETYSDEEGYLGLVLLPLFIAGDVKHTNLKERLKYLEALEKERCYEGN